MGGQTDKAKATYLDVNLERPPPRWRPVLDDREVQSASELPISIDTKSTRCSRACPVQEAAPDQLHHGHRRENEGIFPIVAEYGCSIIGPGHGRAGEP